MGRLVRGITFASCFFFACVGDDAATTSGGPSAPDGGTDGGATEGGIEKGPRSKAAGLAFRDADLRRGTLSGNIVVKKAADESDVAEYRVYFGKSDTAKLVGSPLGASPAKGVDITMPVATDTALPADATHLLAFTANAEGENPTPVAIPLVDNFIEEKAVTIGGAPLALRAPQIAVDSKSKRVVVAGATDPAGKLTFALCDLGLGTCTSKDAAAAQETRTIIDPNLVIDPVGDRLLTFFTSYANGVSTSEHIACALDGTGCVAKNVRGQTTNQAGTHGAIDPVGQRLYVAHGNSNASGRLGLFVCKLDGTSCVLKDVAAQTGAANFTGNNPTVMVDQANQRVVMVTNDSTSYLCHLWRCDLNGDNCTRSDAHAGQPNNICDFPRSTFDASTGHVLTVSRNTIDPVNKQASLFRCDAKTAVCTHANVSAGQPKATAGKASVLVVPETGSLFFLTYPEGTFVSRLYRCNVDGTACSSHDLSTTGGYSDQHGIALDPATGRIYTAHWNDTDKKTHVSTLLAW